MKKKLLLFASMLMLLPFMVSAAKTVGVKVAVVDPDQEATSRDGWDWDFNDVYFYVANGAGYDVIAATPETYEVSGDTVWYTVSELPSPATFFVADDDDVDFAKWPSLRSVELTLKKDAAFLMSMAPDSVLSETDPETWYTNLTETVDPNPAPVATAALPYAPGWEVLESSLVKKENNGPFETTDEHAMNVNSAPGATQDWDSQAWIKFPETLPNGTKVRVYFDYKASSPVTVDTQCHAEPGDYKHYAAIGSIAFTTEWQTYDKMFTVPSQCGGQFKSIAFNLSKDKANNIDFNFKNVYVMFEAPATAEEEGWKVVDAYLLKTEYGISNQVVMENNKGDIECPAKVATDWDSQFWIVLPEALPVGSEFEVAFDYKATSNASIGTQAHANPGNYKHWACIGNVNFTPEWQTYTWKGKVESNWSNDFQSIAFNLSKDVDIVYSIKNLSVKVPSTLTADGDGWEIFDGYWLAKTEAGVGPDKLFAQQKATVHSAARPDDPTATDWDAQFFIVFPEPLKASEKYLVSFEYKSSQDASFDTQQHNLPGQYVHWAAIGTLNSTTEWQTLVKEFKPQKDGIQSIAFNLAKNRNDDVDFFFNAISVKKVYVAPGPEFNEEDAIEGNMLDSLNAYFNIYEEGDELAWHPWGVNAPSREIVTPGWDNTKAAMAVTNTVKGMAYDSQLALYAWDLNPISYYGFDPGYEYTISFMAKADTAASMVLTLEHDGSPWFGDVCEDVFELSTAWKSFEVTMRPSEYGLSLLMFNIGATATTYYFDHIGITRAYAYDVDENVENNMLQGDDFNFDGLTVGNWKVVDGEDAGELSVMEFAEGDAFNAPGMLQFVPSRFGAVYSSQIYIENEFKKDYTYDFSMMTAYLGQFDFGTVQVSFQPLSKPWYGDLCPQVFQLNAGYYTPISGSVTISGEENTCFVLSLGEYEGTYLFDHVIITETDPSGRIQRPTGIEKSEIENNDVIYNTIGQRVNNPVKGQVYMVNGKKVLY